MMRWFEHAGFGAAGRGYFTNIAFWFGCLLRLHPVSLVLFHLFGLPLLIVAAAVTQVGIVRTARWRRDYELSIDRLIRGAKSGGDTFGHHLPS
jgi:hypothetical protein